MTELQKINEEAKELEALIAWHMTVYGDTALRVLAFSILEHGYRNADEVREQTVRSIAGYLRSKARADNDYEKTAKFIEDAFGVRADE